MALQPIDLQTLFTQVEKVGKNLASQREGLQIQASLQSIESRLKTEAEVQSVNETQNTGDGAEGVNDQSGGNKFREDGSRQGGKKPGEKEHQEARGIIRDPALGRNIDFSG